MDKVIDILTSIVVEIPPFIVFLLVVLIGLVIFWKGCTETRKDRSSIFDIFIISSIFGVIYSRISYIIINWGEFSYYTWYWLPYEKYGNDIYLFRLLPWKFFSIWDGGLIIFSLIIGFIAISTLLTVFYKKWRWKQLFFPIYFSAITIFSLSLMFMGVVQNVTHWLEQGAVIFLMSLIAFLVYRILGQSIKKQRLRRYVIGLFGILMTLASGGYIFYSLMSNDLHIMEKINLYTFVVWILLSVILFVIDIRKVNVSIEKISSVRTVRSIDVNQPIRLSK